VIGFIADVPDPGVMQMPPRAPGTRIVNGPQIVRWAISGLLVAVTALALLQWGPDEPSATVGSTSMTMAFTVVVALVLVLGKALGLARAHLAKGDRQTAQRYAQMLPRKRHGAGPSLGAFPELEEEGSRLQAEISGQLQRARDEGSENSEEFGMADQDRVNAALQKIGPQIGHPELGDGSGRFQGDAGDVQFCILVTQAVQQIMAPKSTRWRAGVQLGIGLVGQYRVEAQRRAEFMRRRQSPRRNDPAAAGGDRTPAKVDAQVDKALELLKQLAVDRGYPAAELDRDLKRSPAEVMRMNR